MQQIDRIKNAFTNFSSFLGKYSNYQSFIFGRCNICGNEVKFYFENKNLYRESLFCASCHSTSRYRSIARGVLKAISDLTGVRAESIAELNPDIKDVFLSIYDTQVPFYFNTCAYPILDMLASCRWIDVQTSIYKTEMPWGIKLGTNITNQNLEKLAFPNDSFDIVITSDVMEHVRLDEIAHREIRRVLKPGGIYIFTVPHFRDRSTYFRVSVIDPDDPFSDKFLTEPEYHGDANSEDGRALSYRSYGTDLDKALESLGFSIEYSKQDFPEIGIMNTELFYCRLLK